MHDNLTLDKSVLYINSVNSTYLNNTEQKFYINLIDPIKNALNVKIISMSVLLNPSLTINGNAIVDGDNIYVAVKDYHRLNVNINNNNHSFFDSIPLNISEKFGTTVPNNVVMFKREYTCLTFNVNDINNHILNPADPNLTRIDIELYDKNGNIINNTDISGFNMSLCIYSNKKKVTMI